MGTAVPPSGDFCHFPTFLVRKGQMYSNLPRDQTRFHQLGACEHECFRLAGILIADGDSRQELLETLAAGKYLTSFLSQFISPQVPVIQALPIQATGRSRSANKQVESPGLLESVMSNQSVTSYVGHQAVSVFVVFFYLGRVSRNQVTSGCIELSFWTLQYFRDGGERAGQRTASSAVTEGNR